MLVELVLEKLYFLWSVISNMRTAMSPYIRCLDKNIFQVFWWLWTSLMKREHRALHIEEVLFHILSNYLGCHLPLLTRKIHEKLTGILNFSFAMNTGIGKENPLHWHVNTQNFGKIWNAMWHTWQLERENIMFMYCYKYIITHKKQICTIWTTCDYHDI